MSLESFTYAPWEAWSNAVVAHQMALVGQVQMKIKMVDIMAHLHKNSCIGGHREKK